MQLSRCAARWGRQGAGPWEPDAANFSLLVRRCCGRVSSGFLSRRFLPRKEVIQPHLPVRLPCYDFTPLTLHTFDAYAPEGFGRRLRVQTTRVV